MPEVTYTSIGKQYVIRAESFVNDDPLVPDTVLDENDPIQELIKHPQFLSSVSTNL